MVLRPNKMPVPASKGMVPLTYNELIRIFMTLVYENLVLLKSPQIKVKLNIAISGRKSKTRQTYHIC